MAKIPEAILETELTKTLRNAGVKRFKPPGKVSELWKIPKYGDALLMLNQPRKSIFDFVLNGFFSGTEEVITAMTVLIYNDVLQGIIDTHLMAWGYGIDGFLPESLRENPELQKRALIIKKYEVEKVELIWRFNHTGSAIKSLEETGTVYGYPVRADVKEGERYEKPLFTPTTKEENGHDKPISREEAAEKYGKYKIFSGKVAKEVRGYFYKHGIIAADLKEECSKLTGDVIFLLDKIGPDELRAWDKKDWRQAIKEGRTPKSMDKEILRQWGKKIKTPFTDKKGEPIVGINNLDPKNPRHRAFVHRQKVPQEVVGATIVAYREIFRRLNNSRPLEDFQREEMGIAV